ncbi:CerR family C-terminal domain-containing protein [Polycladidibacter stylochi]|uniref:CerR family C-terminal domain-containing protein n=1 Tax=Polycladidibacter stylochi TaxID=1807766 RepID=UPI000829CA0D|nr:CerR family C-terminal domain-containing protein [Pseudovibrio stylochi]
MQNTQELIHPKTSAGRTKKSLIMSALSLFSSKGYAETTTRDIADMAQANISSIAYHFGGKQGLYNSCADYLIVLARSNVNNRPPCPPEEIGKMTAEEAEQSLMDMVGRMILFMLGSKHSQIFVNFVLREVREQSPAIAKIYQEFISPNLNLAAAYYARAAELPIGSQQSYLTVMGLIGQVLYFKVASYVVLTTLEWEQIGEEEREQIRQTVCSNIRASIKAARGE